MFFDYEFDFAHLIILLALLLGTAAYFIVRDFLDLVAYLNYTRQIKLEKKRYAKYREDKKKLKDRQLEKEREIKESLGLEYPDQDMEYEEEYVLGFAKPIGEFTEKEFQKNMPKFMRIKQALETMSKMGPGDKSPGKMYWRLLEGAYKLGPGRGQDQGRG